ncbi:MAG: FkbM family methyltransferase [Opitutales bacterium]|nr:FkbM family methyltransferase [Opitutales bacterium]
MSKTLLQRIIQRAGRKIEKVGLKLNQSAVKYGPHPGYHRLDKLPFLSTVIDIGVGHNGSPFLYDRFPSAFFISIDPLREAEDAVQRNLKNKKNSFILAAVGKQQKTIQFQVSQTPSRTSLLQRTGEDNDSRPMETREAKMDRLDNLLANLDFARPALLKIDIEGGEYDCLQGGEETLKRVDYVHLELSLTDNYYNSYRFSEVIAFLASRNFEVFQVLKAGNNNVDLLFCLNNDPIRKKWAYGTSAKS